MRPAPDPRRYAARLSLNTATLSWDSPIDDAVRGCEKYGFSGIDPWRQQLHAANFGSAARTIRAAGLRVTGLCRGGFFPAADAAGRAAAMDDNRRAVDEAAELEADCLVIVAGGLPVGSRAVEDSRKQVADGLAELLPHARSCGVRIAIEPMHPVYAADRGCINTLGQALDLCDALGDSVGVAIDVYHVWWDPELEKQIARAGRDGRIFACHVCDWLRETRDPLLDRGMMGDGVIDLAGIGRQIAAAGYAGLVEVEIFSKLDWWTRPADEVLSTCVERSVPFLQSWDQRPS